MIFCQIKRKHLPFNIAVSCLTYYENNDIFLNQDDQYEKEKIKLLNNYKISYNEFKFFIEKTRGNKFSNFKRLEKSKAKKNYKLEYDFYFDNCLYFKPNLWNKNIFNEFTWLIHEYRNKENLIIDLRKSNSGYLDQSLKICNMLLSKCEIVSLKYKNKIVKYLSNNEYIDFKKIFILVSKTTMSSA